MARIERERPCICWIWDFISYQPTLWVIIILIAIFPNTDLLSGIKSGALSKTIGLLIILNRMKYYHNEINNNIEIFAIVTRLRDLVVTSNKNH